MVSLSTTVARRRIFYPRPIQTMPDILMIDMQAGSGSANEPLEKFHPILIETIAEQHELQEYLEEERQVPSSPDLFDARPSALSPDHITIAHYGPPLDDWPYVLLCRWTSDLTATAPEVLRMFVRGAYTVELFADRNRLERASDALLALLKRRPGARVEIVLPDWSAAPGKTPH